MNTIIPLAFFKATGNVGIGVYKIRLINIDKMTVKDIPIHNIKKALLKGVKIKGIRLCTKGNVIMDDKRLDNSTSIHIYEDKTVVSGAGMHNILFKVKGIEAYIICDYTGRPKVVTESELIGYDILCRLCSGVFKGASGRYEVLGDYKVFEVDGQTMKGLTDRRNREDKLNAKLSLMGYPYRVYGNTIDIIDKNVDKLNIVCPVKFIRNEDLEDIPKLKLIIFPRTFEKIDIINLITSTHVGTISVHKDTIIAGMTEYMELKNRGYTRNVEVEIYD